MKVIEHINNSSGTLFSFEILPPIKGNSIQSLYNGIDPLMEFKPSYINVTYHREEYIYKKKEHGLLDKVSIRKRPGTVGICAAIVNRYKVDAVPHLICGGFSKEETENALIDLQFLGIDNVLALRGDAVKSEAHFTPQKDGHRHAVDLVNQITDMNNGVYLHDEINSTSSSDYCIGVAGYPEKHFEAMSLKNDLKFLKQKIEAGAEYVVTQLFFDNRKFFEFEKSCRAIGIDVPIIPGIKPISSLNQISFVPKFFHVDFPDDLVEALETCKTDADVKKVGIEWGIDQSKELIAKGVPSLHYYTMGKSESVRKIAEAVF